MSNLGGSTGGSIGMVFGGVVGGVIGGYPGAMIGAYLGGMVGRTIDPPDAPKPPPVGDLTINSYVRDAPLGVLYGQDKVGGGVIAKGEADTDVNMGKKDSKKGSGSGELKMNVRWAVGHCEGLVEEADPPRHWADDKSVDIGNSDGTYISFYTYFGEESPAGDSYFEDLYSGDIYPFPKLKYTCWSSIHYHLEGTVTNSIPNISLELKRLCNEGEIDANPIICAYDWLTESRYAMGLPNSVLNGDPYTVDTPWKTAADICDELVGYVDSEGNNQEEPRFRYSRWVGEKVKGFDLLTDLFSSCRGLLRYKQGKLEPLIENPDEEPEYYYTERTSVEFVTLGSCTVNKIYADLSSYPDQFWKGASGTYLDEETGIIIEFHIYNQTSTYIDLCSDLGEAFSPGITIKLLKDNIKESSFNFNMIPDYSIPNIYRVEFINRTVWNTEKGIWENEYQNDVIEHETPEFYSQMGNSLFLNQRKIKTVKFNGIKRKSQAMRMAQFLSDATRYTRALCNFITGVEGYQHAVGDIIGVSHIHPGWDKKPFRIIALEEREESEILINAIEYNPDIYNDIIPQVFATGNNSNPSPYVDPIHSERFNAVQDLTVNKIYLCFKRPDAEPYWFGVQVFVQKGVGAEYTYFGMASITSPSVKLASDITDIATTIPFDNSTLYGTFPTSGGFWIEEEYITYTGISGTSFTGCTRTVGQRVAHTADKYCNLKQTDTPYIEFLESDVGNQWTIKILTYTASGLVADSNTAPSDVLTLV